MKSLNGVDGIWSDPNIHGGQPLVEELRVPVYLILEMVAQGFSPEQLATEYGVEERHVQQRRLVLVTKDTDFITLMQYAIGHYGIPYQHTSKTEVQDLVTAVLALATQYPTIANLRFEIQPGAQVIRIP